MIKLIFTTPPIIAEYKFRPVKTLKENQLKHAVVFIILLI